MSALWAIGGVLLGSALTSMSMEFNPYYLMLLIPAGVFFIVAAIWEDSKT